MRNKRERQSDQWERKGELYALPRLAGMRSCALELTNRQRGQSRSIGGCLAHPSQPASCFGAVRYHNPQAAKGAIQGLTGLMVFLPSYTKHKSPWCCLAVSIRTLLSEDTRPEAECSLSGKCPDRVADDCLLEEILTHDWIADQQLELMTLEIRSTTHKLHARVVFMSPDLVVSWLEATLCSDTTV